MICMNEADFLEVKHLVFFGYHRFLLLQLLLADIFLLFVARRCLGPILVSVLEDKSVFKVLIFITVALIEHSRIKECVFLLICFSKSLVFALLQIEELVLHVYTLFVFDYYDLAIRIVALILEPAKLFHIDLLSTHFVMNLHSMHF